jgi:hypothetical protein
LRVKYKPFPFFNRGLEHYGTVFRPVLTVQVVYNHAASKRFEAIVDTGCDCCLFQSHIGESIGIKIKDGVEGPLGGVIHGPRAKVYYHKIKLLVAGEFLEIRAGFSADIDQNSLGQIGFLDHFIVIFDPSGDPPELDVRRILTN